MNVYKETRGLIYYSIHVEERRTQLANHYVFWVSKKNTNFEILLKSEKTERQRLYSRIMTYAMFQDIYAASKVEEPEELQACVQVGASTCSSSFFPSLFRFQDQWPSQAAETESYRTTDPSF